MHYFVTGASGFIGKRLVRRLLARPDSKVWFLLRESSGDRLPDLHAFWGADAGRTVAVYGDVNAVKLGIADTVLRTLSGDLDHVFHLAALTDPAAGAPEQTATNVEGTRNAVALANLLGAKHFHHMSSLGVAGIADGAWREDLFDADARDESPAIASKRAAERIVREECRVPWRIYRPGMVVGDSVTGEADKAEGLYAVFKPVQRLRGLLPSWLPLAVPQGGPVPIVPVDYVVNALNWIAHQPYRPEHGCFHLADPAPHCAGEVLDLLARAAHAPPMPLRLTPSVLALLPEDWRHALRDAARTIGWPDAAQHSPGIPADLAGFVRALLHASPRADQRETATALQGSGITCPDFARYAPAIWDYWERHLDPDLLVDRQLAERVRHKVVLLALQAGDDVPAGGAVKPAAVQPAEIQSAPVDPATIEPTTGAAIGPAIGLAIARRLADAGAITLLCGPDAATLAALRTAIRAQGHDAATYPLDLTDAAAADRGIAQLLADHGKVDVLIHLTAPYRHREKSEIAAAGAMNPGKGAEGSAGVISTHPIHITHPTHPIDDIAHAMQVHCFGPLRLTAGLLPAMRAQHAGHVIALSSVGVLTGAPRHAAAIAALAARDAWTRSTAAGLADAGIRFSTLCLPPLRQKVFDVDDAAEWIVRAIVQQPVRMTPPLGTVAALLHAGAPGLAQAALALLMRSAADANPQPKGANDSFNECGLSADANADAAKRRAAFDQLLQGLLY